jgi:hypothetical protein
MVRCADLASTSTCNCSCCGHSIAARPGLLGFISELRAPALNCSVSPAAPLCRVCGIMSASDVLGRNHLSLSLSQAVTGQPNPFSQHVTAGTSHIVTARHTLHATLCHGTSHIVTARHRAWCPGWSSTCSMHRRPTHAAWKQGLLLAASILCPSHWPFLSCLAAHHRPPGTGPHLRSAAQPHVLPGDEPQSPQHCLGACWCLAGCRQQAL